MTDRGSAHWFAFRGNELLVRLDGAVALLPEGSDWEALRLAVGPAHRVGSLDGVPCHAVELPVGAEPPDGLSFHGLRRLWGILEEPAWRLAGRAVQIVDWDRNHRFCGRCGTETRPGTTPGEFSRTCPSCGLQQFPRLSPAVIVLITDGDRVLLARSPHFAPGVYSTIAGFVEPGESLEETVEREVREEVGVELRDVRYFDSQPWPFPHTLMIGFTAEYAGGELRPQPGEIEDARWFTPHDLPRLPSPMSIARRLVDHFLSRHGVSAPTDDPWVAR